MRGLLLLLCTGIPVPPMRISEMSHAVFLYPAHRDRCRQHEKQVLPQFPDFKCLEWNDRKQVEQYTAPFPPYSDFNFTSLYAWDVDNKMRISDLHGNLVILFSDYVTGEAFLSFIGTNNLPETACTLIDYSKNHLHGQA